MDDQHSQSPIIGVDVSKHKCDVALLLAGKLKHKTIANTPAGFEQLIDWLAMRHVDSGHVCLESTNIYGEALGTYLHERGFVVSIVNPARIKGFAQSELIRTKTDKTDAGLIARFCAAMRPAAWRPDPPEIQALRALVRRLEALIEMRQQELNRRDVAGEIVLEALDEHIAFLDRSIEETRIRIRNHIDNHPDLKHKRDLLVSIPGVGEATIQVVLSEFADIERFDRAKCLASFLGVAPREHQSGQSVRGRTRMSKVGRSQLRKAFFMPALVALRYNPAIKAMKERLLKAGKSKMAIVGAAMRKLVHIIFGVLKNDQPFNHDLCQVQA